MRHVLTVLTCALVLASTPAAQIEVGAGDPAPSLGGKTWFHHPKSSLEDLRGQVVFLDVWRTWCGPCTAQIPHLNKLQEEYGDRGLVVLGITDESKSLVKKHIEKHDMRFPIAIVDPDEEAHFGIRAFPTSMLIDPEGNIVWRGHPGRFESQFKPAELEAMLERTSRMPELSREHSRINKRIAKGELGKAWADAGKSLERGDDDELSGFQETVESMADNELARGSALEEEGAYAQALELYASMTDRFEGMPQERTAAERAAALEEDERAADDIAAHADWVKALKTWRKGQFAKALKAFEDIADDFGGTHTGKRAEELYFRHDA